MRLIDERTAATLRPGLGQMERRTTIRAPGRRLPSLGKRTHADAAERHASCQSPLRGQGAPARGERRRCDGMVDPSERARLSSIYASMFVHSIDGFLLTAPDGHVLRANPRACELLGLSEKDIVERGREGIIDRREWS